MCLVKTVLVVGEEVCLVTRCVCMCLVKRCVCMCGY